MPVNNVASDWPHTFLHPRCFCLALHLHVWQSASYIYNMRDVCMCVLHGI